MAVADCDSHFFIKFFSFAIFLLRPASNKCKITLADGIQRGGMDYDYACLYDSRIR